VTADSETAKARASQEATDWFILLQEEPDDADLRRRFEAWLAADPLHGSAWSVTRHTSALMAQVPPLRADDRRPAVVRVRATASRRPAARWLMAAGTMAIAACVGVLALPVLLLNLQADHVTGAGEVRTVPLADGSTLVLAAESAVEVTYSGTERRINLLAGEAFFTVNPDPARPFRVIANGIETTDLGTAFDVRRNDVGATIAVETGSVRVDYRSVSETLVAGQEILVDWAGGATRGEQAATQTAAWRRKQLIAQDRPMAEVIDRLRPYFNGRIVVIDADLARRRVTGVYNLAEPANALRGIAEARGAAVREVTPWLLVVTSP
jgi:transmembrane sensor